MTAAFAAVTLYLTPDNKLVEAAGIAHFEDAEGRITLPILDEQGESMVLVRASVRGQR